MNGLYPDVLDALRQATYASCRATDNPQPVEALYVDSRDPGALAVREQPFFRFARFTNEALEDDVLHCANRLEVSATADAATLPDPLPEQARVLEGGATPGTHQREATIAVPADGGIVIGGIVRAPPCPVDDPAGDYVLASIDDIEVGRAARSGNRYDLATEPLDLLVANLLNAGGVPSGVGSFDIVLSRQGTGCPSFATPHPLYTLHVNVGDPLVAVVADPFTSVSYFTPVSADCDADDDVQQGGGATLGEDTPLPVTLAVNGASLEIRLTDGDHLVATGSVSSGPSVTDLCTDGSSYTADTSGHASAQVRFVPRQDVVLTNNSNNSSAAVQCAGFTSNVQTGDVIPAQLSCIAFGGLGTGEGGTMLDLRFTPVAP